MNIFEEFDALINKVNAVNESEKKKIKYSEIPIAKGMETYEDGVEYIRDHFKKELRLDVPMPPMPPSPPKPIAPSPPPPPFRKKKTFSSLEEPKKDWEKDDLIWDDDDFLRRLEIEAEELEKERELLDKELEEYDDFTDAKDPKGDGDDDKLADSTPKKDSFTKKISDDEYEDDIEHKKHEDDDDDDDDEEEKKRGGKSGKGEKGGKSDSSGGSGGGEEDEDDSFVDKKESSGGSGKSKKDKSKKGGEDTEGGGDGEEGEEEGDEGDDEGSGSGKGKKGKKGKKGDEGEDEDGSGSGSGEDGEEGDEGDDEKSSGSGKGKKGEEGEDEDGSGSGSGEDGDDDSRSGKKSSEEELKEAIEDAIKRMKESGEIEKEELEELVDMLDDDSVTEEDLDDFSKKIDEEREGKRERFKKASELVGKIEEPVSLEDLKKEIEASKLSKEEIEKMKEATLPAAEVDTLPTDDEVDMLKKKAMEELDKKCKGKSRLSSSILYHSLRTPKLDKDDWDRIIEKVLNRKSNHAGKEKSKIKKLKLGDKNHIWRDVRYTYSIKKEGIDTQSIYCFIDYSGSVKCHPGLIITFLGKVLELCDRLEYSDLTCYTFADYLSVPRIINKNMIKKDEYETVLAQTIEFFDLPENNVGGRIENFSIVGDEINRIKRKDKDAVFFIFGDGIWTFYDTQTEPPQRLLEICPRWIEDIIAFVFIPEEKVDNEAYKQHIMKEIAVLKDVVGIKDVILTEASKMKE